ncbi:MAG: PD40 domain-containing protein [Deltaproteobacteria bacterium]|nr:PD40 domain-containing protein [Deltaproteobacteria bacterium]
MSANMLKSLFISVLLLPLVLPIANSGALAQKEARSHPLGMLAYLKGGNLCIKELPDGQPQQLTTDGRSPSFRWAPSGQWLAYVKDDGFWVVRPSGANAKALSPSAPVNSFIWAPSSEWVAYVKDDRVWVVRPSGANAKALSAGAKVHTFAWSPVSNTLAYMTHTGSVHVAKADEWRERGLVVGNESEERLGFFGLAWSPDEQWLIYVQEEMAKEKQPPDNRYVSLWRIRADGSNPTELFNTASAPGGLMVAGWSPDSQYILLQPWPLFSMSLLADGTSLLALLTSGGRPKKLVESMLTNNDFLAWAPDGKLLAVTAGGGRETWSHKRIAIVELTNGTLTYLTDEKTAAFSPAWSPDGHQIAYVAAPDIGFVGGGEEAKVAMAKRRIWVMNRDGSEKRPLTHDAAYRDERPLWSADSSHILFARMDQQGRASLWLMRDNGSEVRQVADLSPAPDRFGYYGYISWDGYFNWWRGTPRRP